MYFVPKVLFTSVNNSVSSAICSEILIMVRVRFWRECVGMICTCWSQKVVQYCLYYYVFFALSAASGLIYEHTYEHLRKVSFVYPTWKIKQVQDQYSASDARCVPAPDPQPVLGYFISLPSEGAVVPCSLSLLISKRHSLTCWWFLKLISFWKYAQCC